ncbi:subtilisin [Runella defluvii]|uniref:Subtilisin n=1 Tax=Runella defluvii TaxID=370973 RepID=A0A7W5ZMQ8_9BACT|nr:S8 family peptidase [Runella defluvii]MBB3840198.1 subtilisin [Runella defluvii]
MAKAKNEKRYIVTYMDADTTQQEAASILGISDIQDGVSIMATDKTVTSADVFHFEGLGASSLTLTAAEVEKLKNDEKVLAVEEDIEMHILEENINWDVALTETNDQFQEGYKKGIADLFAKFTATAKELYEQQSSSAIPPIVPIQPPLVPPIVIPPQPIPWNINMVKAPRAWSRGIRGEGIKVAVLDTGIASHPDLVISGGVSFVPGVVSFNDGNSHGTHCAGIIAARNNFFGVVGVAPRASLYAVKVLSDGGSGSTSWILAGMAWARQNGMHVVSMSLGSSSCQSVAYTNAIATLNNAGITVVCASGNAFGTGFPCVGSPANSPGAIAVGAVAQNGVIAPFSSRGVGCCPPGANPVTLVAPGVSINSTVLGNGYGIKSGTSMACPHVAGAAVLVKQRFPFFTPAQIRLKLMATASDLGAPGNDPTYGMGLVNCDLATL